MPLEEDMVNMGYWILMNHSNFFEGSRQANFRYAIWLSVSLLILSI
jgi:hypothetical protein